jgi:prepilin-type N-terminal cleavage/methylation domain-containing protein
MMPGLHRGWEPAGVPGRGGMTLVELLIAMVLLLVILAGAVPVFTSGQRGADRQEVVQAVQGEFHASTEFLLRAVRNAQGVEEGSGHTTLILGGSEAGEACGVESDEPFRIHLTPTGLRCGPLSGASSDGRLLAANVEAFHLSFGVDSDGDGRVDTFVDDPSAFEPEDIVAVRFQLDFAGASSRGPIQTRADFMAVLRGPVSNRIQLWEG